MSEPRHRRELRARRRAASRRRRLARVDVAAGVVAAVVLLLASPGLAIAGIVALLLLLACGISLFVDRLLSARAARAPRSEDRERTNGRGER